jgi:hypothetical protein
MKKYLTFCMYCYKLYRGLLFVCLGPYILTCSYRLFPCMIEKVTGKLDQGVTLMMYLGSAWFIGPSGHITGTFFVGCLSLSR